MMPFFNRTGLERVGVVGLDCNCHWAGLQAPDMALLCKDKKEERAGRGFVTPPTRHPKWVSSEGVTLLDCDCLTFSFSELTLAFICTNSVIKKILFTFIFYTYHHSGIHYILYPYTRVPLLVLLQFTITKLYIKSEIAEQCDEHLSLRWPALLMWNVLSSIIVL